MLCVLNINRVATISVKKNTVLSHSKFFKILKKLFNFLLVIQTKLSEKNCFKEQNIETKFKSKSRKKT